MLKGARKLKEITQWEVDNYEIAVRRHIHTYIKMQSDKGILSDAEHFELMTLSLKLKHSLLKKNADLLPAQFDPTIKGRLLFFGKNVFVAALHYMLEMPDA